MIAIADYGMGNRRSVEKALAHVGAESVITADTTRSGDAAAIILPGVGAFPEAMRNLERTGLGEVLIERAAAGVPLLGICLGMQLLFESTTEHEGAAGPRASCPATVTRLESPRLPHIGWNLVTFERESALTEGLGDAAAFYHVHSFACRPSDRVRRRRHERVRRALRLRRRARERDGRAVPPREVIQGRSAHAAQFRHAGGGRGRMILYPAIDIMDGQAVRLVEGRFEDSTTYHDTPLEAARSWVEAGARFLHVVDLDGARSGEPKSLEHLRAIVQETGIPIQYGGGLRTVDAVRDALRAGAERAIVGTAAFRDIDFLDDIVAAFGPADRRRRRRQGRDDRHRGLDADDVAARRRGDQAPDRPRRALVRLHRRLARRDADRRRPRRRQAVAGAVRGRFIYSGGIGTLDDLRALAQLRQVNLAGVIAGKSLYEKKFTVAEGQAALDDV